MLISGAASIGISLGFKGIRWIATSVAGDSLFAGEVFDSILNLTEDKLGDKAKELLKYINNVDKQISDGVRKVYEEQGGNRTFHGFGPDQFMTDLSSAFKSIDSLSLEAREKIIPLDAFASSRKLSMCIMTALRKDEYWEPEKEGPYSIYLSVVCGILCKARQEQEDYLPQLASKQLEQISKLMSISNRSAENNEKLLEMVRSIETYLRNTNPNLKPDVLRTYEDFHEAYRECDRARWVPEYADKFEIDFDELDPDEKRDRKALFRQKMEYVDKVNSLVNHYSSDLRTLTDIIAGKDNELLGVWKRDEYKNYRKQNTFDGKDYMLFLNDEVLPLYVIMCKIWNLEGLFFRYLYMEESYKIAPYIFNEKVKILDRELKKSKEKAQNDHLERLVSGINRQEKNLKKLVAASDELINKKPPMLKIRTNEKEDKVIRYEPVFSSAFDSARSTTEGNRNDVERTILQLAASGKTILLQGPQIVDNLDVLKLISEENLNSLLRYGVITYSPYYNSRGKIGTPKEYFLGNFGNKGFESTSFPFIPPLTDSERELYLKQGQEDLADAEENRRSGIRKIVFSAVEEVTADTAVLDSATSKAQEELKKLDLKDDDISRVQILLKAMSVMKENMCAGEPDKYLQGDNSREQRLLTYYRIINNYGSMSKNNYTLPNIIKHRLEELIKDDKCNGSHNKNFLKALQLIDSHMVANRCLNRSQYAKQVKFIQENLANGNASGLPVLKNSDYEIRKEHLEAYRLVVDRSYNVFQGYLSANHLYLPEYDSRLRIFNEPDTTQANLLSVDYFVNQYQKTEIRHRTTLDWANIEEIVLTSREIQANPDLMTPDQIAAIMENELSVRTTVKADGHIEIVESNIKTTSGDSAMGYSDNNDDRNGKLLVSMESSCE